MGKQNNGQMIFEQNKLIEKLGMNVGFIFSYFLFTTTLFGMFLLMNKLPGINYFHVSGITLLITLFGFTLKKLLQ